MKNVAVKILSVFLALTTSTVFACVTYKNFPVDGELTVTLPTTNQRQITRLGPEPRIRITATNQAIVEGPVYFDIRVLPWFHTAKIEMVYQENGQALDGIALQSAAGWSYNLKKPDSVEVIADGWSKAIFNFDLAGGYQVRNVRRFLIGTQQTDSTARGELTIQSLRVHLLW